MERNISENPYSPASQPPENQFNPPSQRSMSTENHSQASLITNLQTSHQPIESAFSRLSLSQEFRPRVLTPSFLGLPATTDGVASGDSVPLPVALGENQQTLLWAGSQSNNGSINGPFGFIRAHQNIDVGPEGMGFLGSGSYLEAGDLALNLMPGPDCCDGTCGNYDCFSLHDKKPFSRNAINDFPALISAQQCNFCIPRPSVYSNQFLKQWQQLLTLKNMGGRIVSLAQDQAWSGVLNLKLEEGLSNEEIEMVLLEVMDFLGDLMRNQFGSLFVNKLFVACNEDQRNRMIVALTKFPLKLISSCLNSYGARAMQKLLEKLITPQQISLVVSALSLGAVALSTDPNGQHVIQYCVKNFPAEYNKHLFNEIAANCFRIATNKSGCCVLQSCVENSDQEARELLISNIIANAVHLAEDPYGNYVVQHLLGMKIEKATADLLRQFKGYFLPFSCNKYASNVVEKFFLELGENHSATIITELLRSPEASMLLLDPFGNFVIQSALSVSKGHIHEALLNLIQDNAVSMQNNLYGKKILASFEKGKLHNA